ncbi:transcriptional accessory protein Tex/SPT6 [Rhizobium mongolense]|uniref:Transcriptional accessory protein Tex/SPT6 n=1 Tax=Rhizobium mongolense TaxID=57676 RepID=A0ABR6IXH5_9HYPH|nr:transcriptional accessory protein Tex/SPT6 [Rhizobium mongolense]
MHISQLASDRVAKTSDVVKEGDKVWVKLMGFDERGKVRLSMKVVDPGNRPRNFLEEGMGSGIGRFSNEVQPLQYKATNLCRCATACEPYRAAGLTALKGCEPATCKFLTGSSR